MSTRSFHEEARDCLRYVHVDPYHTEGIHGNYFRFVLAKMALDQKSAYFQGSVKGFLKATPDEVRNMIFQLVGGFLVRKDLVPVHKSYVPFDPEQGGPIDHYRSAFQSNPDCVYQWAQGVIEQTEWSGETRFVVASTQESDLVTVLEALGALLSPTTGRADISVITQGHSGPYLCTVGKGGTPLIRDNYTPDITRAFDHIVQDIESCTPCGRLVILTGHPGTGKTYFIEGIINAQIHCRYVLLPPAILASVAAPELLRALLPEEGPPGRSRGPERNRVPIVLVIEDADQCLMSRDPSNLPAISTILNLADGILGRTLDIRIIATSNAAKTDIDPALLRDGRLCRALDIKPLTHDHAQAIYAREVQRLTGQAPTEPLPPKINTTTAGFSRPGVYTLADIYRLAKGHNNGTRI